MIITPEQSRAARALLDWSQDALAGASGVAKKTIADFERGAQIPYEKTLCDLAEAFEANGVTLIPENGGGAGVRKKAAIPRLTRSRISRSDRIASMTIGYRNREYRVRLSTTILDDMDRTNHSSEEALERSFKSHLNRILLRAAEAIDAGEAVDGELLLSMRHFPEA